jgi:hypothetical protein
MSQLDKLEQMLREHIAADLDRRADALRSSIAVQTGKAEKSACYVASVALRTAAAHVRQGKEFRPGELGDPVIASLARPMRGQS